MAPLITLTIASATWHRIIKLYHAQLQNSFQTYATLTNAGDPLAGNPLSGKTMFKPFSLTPLLGGGCCGVRLCAHVALWSGLSHMVADKDGSDRVTIEMRGGGG